MLTVEVQPKMVAALKRRLAKAGLLLAEPAGHFKPPDFEAALLAAANSIPPSPFHEFVDDL